MKPLLLLVRAAAIGCSSAPPCAEIHRTSASDPSLAGDRDDARRGGHR